jgi:hypothetical protein
MVVDPEAGDGAGESTAGAAAVGGGEVDGEDLAESTGQGVAVLVLEGGGVNRGGHVSLHWVRSVRF